MKYNNEIEINLPVEKVVELFDNPDNLKYWMPGFESFEHISGEPGMPGAKSRLSFQMGKRKMVMTETVIRRNLPSEFSGVYEMNNVRNEIINRFESIGPGKTRYSTENVFHFSGVMKIVGWLMPGAFKKTSQDYLERFKKFAEGKQTS